MPISVFTFLRTFRPGTSYFVYYLTKVKGVTDDYMNNWLLLVMTAFYLCMMFVLGACTYRFGYKCIIPVELGCQILARVMFLWGTNYHSTMFIVGYFAYGIAMAGECMLYVYRTSIVRDDHALLITSVGSCALYLSTLLQ